MYIHDDDKIRKEQRKLGILDVRRVEVRLSHSTRTIRALVYGNLKRLGTRRHLNLGR